VVIEIETMLARCRLRGVISSSTSWNYPLLVGVTRGCRSAQA
jgi:hypothetical protein